MREPKPQEDLQAIIDDIYRELTPRLGEGKVADYIPQLARVDARHFGMAIVTTGGEVYRVGDAEMPFSIQSISKVFTLTLALGKHGENSNIALANFMRSFGRLDHPVEHVLGVYFHHCALAMTCSQLAKAGLFLAAGGTNPLTGHSVVSRQRARRINALMLTCGHYDGSGDFAYRVGLPGKSGVGGGIMAVAPGKASIAVWSPGLNDYGNSLLGSLALEMLAARTGWSVFGP
ncbi:glutaminase [Sinorhizobium meliloti]|uniref:glutaminase n=1 Tax=Rhizobium meliloti TaxID=382 RepID=UPI000FD8812D|nr:glutaminase [Sinorhizobium meliloti]RVL75996.1 glutaminase [Sinorhizobium meliloti]